MIVGLFKVLTAPVWIIPWLVIQFFKARALIRAGRPVYPVSSRSIKLVRVPSAVPPAPKGLPGSQTIPPPPP